MMMLVVLCLCLLAVSVSASVPDLKSLVDAQYRDWVAAHPWVGIAVGIIHPNFTTPQFFSYGHQNGPISPWINPDTMFAINSMTKVFTSTVLAQNAMQGRVELSDFVQKYTQHPLATDGGQSYEFLDLATHWSGLPTRPTNLPNPDYINYTDTQFYDFMQSYNFSSLHGSC
jgi:CubicO group peptidase (beta-lactamase class C family)